MRYKSHTDSWFFFIIPGGAPGANGGRDNKVGGGGNLLTTWKVIVPVEPALGPCVEAGRGISSIWTLWACFTLS